MKQNNGNRNDHATHIMENQTSPQVSAPTVQSDVEVKTELATRTKLRARQKIQQNRFVIVAAGAVRNVAKDEANLPGHNPQAVKLRLENGSHWEPKSPGMYRASAG